METDFTKGAGANRIYLFRLMEATGVPWKFNVTRNGEVLEMTGELTLLLNPEELVKEHAARSTVNQTPHDWWVDDFGMGLPKWTLRGTMGFQAKPAFGVVGPDAVLDGYSGYHAFADLIEEYFQENRRRAIQASTGQALTQLLRLEFIDTWDDDAWVIQPDGLPTKHRNISHNPTIKYDFKFTGLQDLRVRSTARQLDPIGQALLGGAARQAAIARAIDAHKTVLEGAIAGLAVLEKTAPGLMAPIHDLMRCGNAVQFSEPASALQQRESLLGLATTTETDLATTLAEAKALGPVSPSLESAMTMSMQESRLLGGGAGCKGRLDVGNLQAGWAASFDSMAGAVSGGAGDDHILAVFSADKIATLKQSGTSAVATLQSAAPGDLSQVPTFTTASAFFTSTIQPVSGLGGDLGEVAQGTKGSIDLGLGTVSKTVGQMRKGMGSVQSAMYQLRVLSTGGQQLRGIKRGLNNYLCAVQSVLAFPYLFGRDLRTSLQGVLDLFQQSGCSTSFPNLQGLSWEPHVQTPKVITA